VGALSFSLHYEYTSLGAVALGAVALGAVALVAAAGSASATGTPAGSDALLQLLQLETDMLHNSTSFLSWIGETSRVCPLLNGGPSRRPSDGGWALRAGKSIPNKA